MWWYKEHKEPYEKWVFYPWYKAIRYATYQDWQNDFPNAIGDVKNGFVEFWRGMFSLLTLSVQWVLTPILKPIAFIRILPKMRKGIEDELGKRVKIVLDEIFPVPPIT